MNNSTKVQYVPTVLLDTVLAVSLKKHLKTRNVSVPKKVKGSKVVIYKMISTEEWQKKEALRIARDIAIKAKREKPIKTKEEQSKDNNAYNAFIMPSGLSRRQEYYIKNKERILLKQKQKNKKKK